MSTILKVLSGILIVATVFLNFKHGWAGISGNLSPEEAKMMADLGISKVLLLAISAVSLAVCALILFPATFFHANYLNAALIVLIMTLALRAGNLKIALIEIPFLLMPLLMAYLGHPLKK